MEKLVETKTDAVKPENTKPENYRLPGLAGCLLKAVILVTGISTGGLLHSRVLYSDINAFFGKPYLPSFSPDSLTLEPNREGANLPAEISHLQRKTDSLNGSFFEFARRQDAEASFDIFRQIAIEHVFDYLNLLNAVNKQTASVDQHNKLQVSLDQESYNLSHPLEFQALFSMSSLKLEAANLDQEINKATDEANRKSLRERKNKNTLNQEAILWLKQQNLNISLSENGVLLATPNSLANFARALQWNNKLGYSYPRTGLFGPSPDVGGSFLKKGPYSSQSSIIDYLNPYGDLGSLIHEIGHFISEAPEIRNPDFPLEAFDKAMKSAEKGNLQAVKRKNEIHYYLAKEQREKRYEQYAGFFAEYFVNGTILRTRIAQMESDDPAAAEILRVAYSFFKQLFQGAEFINDGLTQDDLNQQAVDEIITQTNPSASTLKPEIIMPVPPQRFYAVGKRVTVIDKDIQRPGILLKDEPKGPSRTDLPAVFDHDIVEIIEGPVEIVTAYELDEKTMVFIPTSAKWWKVQIKMQGSQSYSKLGFRDGENGWIEERWLGDIYIPK